MDTQTEKVILDSLAAIFDKLGLTPRECLSQETASKVEENEIQLLCEKVLELQLSLDYQMMCEEHGVLDSIGSAGEMR